jgi:hypothetical protein
MGVKKLLVLLRRDLREAGGQIGLLLGLLTVLVLTIGQTPLVAEPEVAKIISELLALLLTAAPVAIVVVRQRTDLTAGRLRHLLSLPVTPAQVLLSKLMVCGLLSVVVLMVVNSLWFLGHTPAGLAFGIGSVLRATVDMWLVVLLLWSLMILLCLVGKWITVLVFSGALVMIHDIPESYHPLTLGMPTEAAGQPMLWARIITVTLTVVLFVACERLLTLRPVE